MIVKLAKHQRVFQIHIHAHWAARDAIRIRLTSTSGSTAAQIGESDHKRRVKTRTRTCSFWQLPCFHALTLLSTLSPLFADCRAFLTEGGANTTCSTFRKHTHQSTHEAQAPAYQTPVCGSKTLRLQQFTKSKVLISSSHVQSYEHPRSPSWPLLCEPSPSSACHALASESTS